MSHLLHDNHAILTAYYKSALGRGAHSRVVPICADVDEDIALLQEQLDEEVEYSTEMYERAQLAEADLATLRADLAANQVELCPSLVLTRRVADCGAAKVLQEP